MEGWREEGKEGGKEEGKNKTEAGYHWKLEFVTVPHLCLCVLNLVMESKCLSSLNHQGPRILTSTVVWLYGGEHPTA